MDFSVSPMYVVCVHLHVEVDVNVGVHTLSRVYMCIEAGLCIIYLTLIYSK